jgi:poly(3-hydroxybutyrate) depolymerase
VIYSVPANYPGFGRKVYPGFLQHAGFVAMNPRRHAQSHCDFYMHLRDGDDASAEAHRKFYDEYNAVLDMPAEYYLDTIKTVFQDFAWPVAPGKSRQAGASAGHQVGRPVHRRRRAG